MAEPNSKKLNNMAELAFNTVEEAIKDFKEGKFVIVVDDEDRENEGDFIIAADNAKFGQPEIKLGIIPGAGGTQRLPRAVGKAKAMDMILTGRMMDAQEAERAGLVSRVVPVQDLTGEALKAAEAICSFGQVAVMAAKECVNRAFESALSDGVMHERRLFNALFATADHKEGMDAFLNKRPAQFANR